MAEPPYDWRKSDPELGDGLDPDWRTWLALIAALVCVAIAMYLLWQLP
jgi:hypothetical protein